MGWKENFQRTMERVIKRNKEAANLCALYNISKEQAETIQRGHYKLCKVLVNPISLKEFASQIMGFETWCIEMDNMNRNVGKYAQAFVDNDYINLSPELFHDKERCDAFREIVTLSPLEYNKAAICIAISKNIERDKEIIIKLSCAGYGLERIKQVINILNK